MGTKVYNCKITGTHLGYGRGPILHLCLYLEGDGWQISFGEYALDNFVEATGEREPWAEAMSFVAEIMRILGAGSWEELVGMHIRAEIEDGVSGRCIRVGHLIRDQWFSFEGVFVKSDIERKGNNNE